MPIIRSLSTAAAASGLPLERDDSSAVGGGRAGRPARPRPTALQPPRSNGKPEAATAFVGLLMMGMRMPKTYWAVFKRQAINLRNCCIWLVDSFECIMMHELANPKFPFEFNRENIRVNLKPQIFIHSLPRTGIDAQYGVTANIAWVSHFHSRNRPLVTQADYVRKKIRKLNFSSLLKAIIQLDVLEAVMFLDPENGELNRCKFTYNI
jgi:hypothetical protein